MDSELLMSEGARFSEVNLRSARVRGPVDMSASTFSGPLDMNNLRVEDALFMRDGARFEEVILLAGRIGGHLDMSGSSFSGRLDLDSLQASENVFMNDKSDFMEVVLAGARVEGFLTMVNSRFGGPVNMNSTQVGEGLLMSSSQFGELILRFAEIDGQLSLADSTFGGTLDMESVKVAGSVFMDDESNFQEVILNLATVGCQLVLESSTFAGPVDLEGIRVGDAIFMGLGAEFETDVYLAYSRIGGNLVLSGGTLSYLDLTNAEVFGELSLGPPAAQWQSPSRLILGNLQAAIINDLPIAWPDSIVLKSFNYSRLGGSESKDKDDLANRNVDWFKDWLRKEERYSPQPHEQLATVLKEAGHGGKARDILYASRQREWSNSSGFQRVSLTLQDLFIGYGYHLERTFYWLLFFVALGAIVPTVAKQDPAPRKPQDRVSYSLDLLLPIVRLR